MRYFVNSPWSYFSVLGNHPANKQLRGQVRRGEKPTPIVFWRIYADGVEVKASGEQHESEHEQEQRQGKRRFVLRYYSVFNTEQCELPASVAEELAIPEEGALDPIEACEKVLAEMPNAPEIQHAGDKAFYSPMTDWLDRTFKCLFRRGLMLVALPKRQRTGRTSGSDPRRKRL
jgi:antirestriction protein ArdC